MNLRITFLAATGVLLSGCVTLGFEAAVEDLSLVREEPAEIVAQYPPGGISRRTSPLTGMLRLDVSVDIDLMELKEDGLEKEGLNVWYDAVICDSQAEIMPWPIVYQNKTVSSNTETDIHHYSVFMNTSWRGSRYDLKQQPESICVVFGAGQMGHFFDYRSNTIVIDREEVIRAFEGGQ